MTMEIQMSIWLLVVPWNLPLTCLNRVATSTGPPQRTIQMWRRPAPSSLTRTAARWGWWGQRWLFTRHWSHIGWGDCNDWAWDVYDVQELTAGNQATVCGSKRRIRKTLWNQRKPLLKQVVIKLFKSAPGVNKNCNCNWKQNLSLISKIVVFSAAKDQN